MLNTISSLLSRLLLFHILSSPSMHVYIFGLLTPFGKKKSHKFYHVTQVKGFPLTFLIQHYLPWSFWKFFFSGLFWPFVFFLECCFNFVFLYICDIPHVWCVRLYHPKVMHPIFSFDLNSFIILQLTINGHKILLFLWFYKAHLAWTLQPGPWYSQNFSVSVCLRQIKRYALNNCPAFVARFNAARIQMEYIKESSQAASWIVQGTLQVHKCL